MRSNERWRHLRKSPLITARLLFKRSYNFRYDLMPVRAENMPLSKIINLLRSGLNLFYRKLYPWSWPTHMHIELTNYCNLSCKVCPTGAGALQRKQQYIEPDLLSKLINQLSPYLMTTSLWAWGEPLLHPQLEEILKIVHNRGIITILSTNGQNLNDERVQDALIKYPPTYLIVALDGLTDETNQQFRVGAKIAPALEGVRSLREKRDKNGAKFPRLHMRYIVMRHNEHEVPQLPNFAANNHFDLLTIRTLSVIDGPENVQKEMVPENEKYRAYQYQNDQRIKRNDFICEKCFTFPAVFADGTVVTCDQNFNAFKPLGVFSKTNSFKDVWWSSQAAGIRKVIRDNPDNFSYCKNCPFRDREVSTCSVEYHEFTVMEK